MKERFIPEPKYMNDNPVYSFYFDWETGKLKYKKLLVAGYDYMDVPRNIIDEYKLIEETVEREYVIFKKKGFKIHKVQSHLISDDICHAKLKFLYHFLKDFEDNKINSLSDKILKMVLSAKTYYKSILKENPDIILKAVTEKLADVDKDIFWR